MSDDRYPHSPGYQNRDTSREAAYGVKERCGHLREAVRNCILGRGGYGATADEVASLMGESVLSIRPRTTELSKQLKIRDSGARRKNASGKNAIVWVSA